MRMKKLLPLSNGVCSLRDFDLHKAAANLIQPFQQCQLFGYYDSFRYRWHTNPCPPDNIGNTQSASE